MAISAIQTAKRNTDLLLLQEQNAVLSGAVETLEERLADVVLALDDAAGNWKPMGQDVDATEIPLATIQATSQVTRALVAINPLIKRGVAVRTAYVWGEGVEFEGISATDPLLIQPGNKKFIFSPQAQTEMETVLATDGNLFTLLTKGKGANGVDTIARVPLKQITGTVCDPENHEDVWFYKRDWDVTVEQSSGVPSTEHRIAYFPAVDYDVQLNGKPRSFRGYPVIYDSVILHVAPNKQTGWKWGVADLMSVIFWTKAYKEFLENSAALVKAYMRFAYKVTSPTRQGAQSAATKVAAQPVRDPLSGEVSNIGGTAVMGMGTTMSAIGKTGSAVDFNAGLPLAAMVAAGLDIPLITLTSDAGSANRSGAETLNDPTVKSMVARQKLWTGFYDQLFKYFGKDNVKIIWPLIESEPVYRKVQAIAQAALLNVLSAQEIRDLLVEAFDLSEDGHLPSEAELGNLILAAKQAMEQSKVAAAAKAENQAGSGANPDTAQASYGDNGYRNDAGQHAYSGGKNG